MPCWAQNVSGNWAGPFTTVTAAVASPDAAVVRIDDSATYNEPATVVINRPLTLRADPNRTPTIQAPPNQSVFRVTAPDGPGTVRLVGGAGNPLRIVVRNTTQKDLPHYRAACVELASALPQGGFSAEGCEFLSSGVAGVGIKSTLLNLVRRVRLLRCIFEGFDRQQSSFVYAIYGAGFIQNLYVDRCEARRIERKFFTAGGFGGLISACRIQAPVLLGTNFYGLPTFQPAQISNCLFEWFEPPGWTPQEFPVVCHNNVEGPNYGRAAIVIGDPEYGPPPGQWFSVWVTNCTFIGPLPQPFSPVVTNPIHQYWSAIFILPKHHDNYRLNFINSIFTLWPNGIWADYDSRLQAKGDPRTVAWWCAFFNNVSHHSDWVVEFGPPDLPSTNPNLGPAGGQYAPQCPSSLIDSGSPIAAWPTPPPPPFPVEARRALNGVTRPVGHDWDVGAHERTCGP